ncbi:hypothetical protein [uncultured Methanospirillum sp.]|uniref:hypothetical protein n=1 Tax=uncultured Methanospirillum sp. TaxID=262503 RepID=UPI0029C9A691|nr:hypothetical protein [uncultured Methanospirillum sp.]
MTEDLQYVYDDAGHKTAVIVPIEIWERVAEAVAGKRIHDLSRYYGVYRDYMPNPDKIAQEIREEWDRRWSHILLTPIF